MSESGAPHATSPARGRLTRSRHNRVIFGVCGGLGEYFGVDPVIFRVGVIVLTLAGGSGVLLYVIGWLAIPEHDGGPPVGARLLHTRSLWGWAAIGLLVLIALASIDDHNGGIWLLAGVGVAIWLFGSEPRRAGRGAAAPEATAGVGAAEGSTETAPSPPPRRRRGPSVTRTTLSLLLVAGGVTWLLDEADAIDVTIEQFLSAALIAIGTGLVIGAFLGRGRRLILLGAAVAVVVASSTSIDVPLRGGVGDRSFRPVTIAELEPSYRRAAGSLTLDLRSVPWAGQTARVEVSVGAGDLLVIVPPEVTVTVHAEAGVGEVRLFGARDDGIDVTADETQTGVEGAGRLTVDARVGFGEVEVRNG